MITKQLAHLLRILSLFISKFQEIILQAGIHGCTERDELKSMSTPIGRNARIRLFVSRFSI